MHSVLLVDDEVYARIGLRKLIDWKACGFEVVGEADNGEDALELIATHQPDLVITDIRMPVVDGLTLIRTCIDRFKKCPKFIIISGYDDFNYAQQAVRFGVHDFILKPVDEQLLQQTLVKLAKKLSEDQQAELRHGQALHDRLITSVVKGEYSEAEMTEWADQLGYPLESALHYILIEINDLHPWREAEPLLSESDIIAKLKSLYCDLLEEDEPIYVYEHRNQYGFILFAHDLERTKQQARDFAIRLQHKLDEAFGTKVYVYVSTAVEQLAALATAYTSAKQAVQYKYVIGEQQVIIADEIGDLTVHYVDMDQQLYHRLIEHVEEENKERCKQVIDLIFKQFQEQHFAPEAVKLSLHRCVTDILKISMQMNIDEDDFTTLKPMLGWHDLNISPAELKRLFTQFVAESAALISQHRKDQTSGTIQKIKLYIEQHYAENISLKSIAHKFYINPVYLGQLFKKVNGVYFNEFLLELRITEAKRLLRQTDKKIYEIADDVGFRNADYFVSQFAKVEGMTPTEYRNSLL